MEAEGKKSEKREINRRKGRAGKNERMGKKGRERDDSGRKGKRKRERVGRTQQMNKHLQCHSFLSLLRRKLLFHFLYITICTS